MYESRHEPLSPLPVFLTRLLKNFFFGLAFVAISLSLGMVGYHYTENIPWIDAFLDAAMILSGMGPVSPMQTQGGKIFAGTYALFSGIVFLIAMAIIFAPIFHRLMHRFHIKER